MCWTSPYTRHKTKTTKPKTHHNMCWTSPYTRHKTKTNKAQNTIQYVLDITIHKTQDEDKQNKKHTTISVGHHHTQDTRRRPTKLKTQRNICWTPPYTRHKTNTITKNTSQYVMDTTIHKTQDEDKQNKKHNTIYVGHHHTQNTRRRQTKQNTTQYVLDTTIHKTQDEDQQS